MPYTEDKFNGPVILSLVFVYLLHCSTLSPLRFISSGNIFNFSCMAAFAHCFIACWGCALSIISKVPGENTIKTKAKCKSKTKAWKKLRRNKNKCRKWYKTQRTWCESHGGIIYQLNVQILPQQSWSIMVLSATHCKPSLVMGRFRGFWTKILLFLQHQHRRHPEWPSPVWWLNTSFLPRLQSYSYNETQDSQCSHSSTKITQKLKRQHVTGKHRQPHEQSCEHQPSDNHMQRNLTFHLSLLLVHYKLHKTWSLPWTTFPDWSTKPSLFYLYFNFIFVFELTCPWLIKTTLVKGKDLLCIQCIPLKLTRGENKKLHKWWLHR